MTNEYKVENKSCERDFDRRTVNELKYLNDMGNKGWELCSVLSEAPRSTYDSTTYYWKRLIPSY